MLQEFNNVLAQSELRKTNAQNCVTGSIEAKVKKSNAKVKLFVSITLLP